DLIGPDGSTISTWVAPPSDLAVLPYTAASWGQALSERVTFWGFLAPLLAVGFGYAAYARPRGVRALEPILALPTTRLAVLGRRYLSALLPLTAATGLATVIEFQVDGPDPNGLGAVLVAAIWGSLALEGAAFLGIVFLLAHVIRSAAAVAALTIALDAFLAYFVTAGIWLVASLSGHYPSAAAINAAVLDNPTQLTAATVAAYFAGLGSPGIPARPIYVVGAAPPSLPSPGATFEIVVAMVGILAIGTMLLAAGLARYRD
ncbi:MAG: hypothetical protein L3K05_01335, partial [Thermoplasmata archaeon]|nr:hypothetical protein [Thermoplasmata archaeon]